ncbi:hypothetical protein SAMN05216282_11922 [Cryobacterium psychrotolerans]|uniref:Uncharacterized protein n=1 Tax=Cryobacterium psychrotolerans TaxID=386301 RepID=A0A1G9G1H0_9MICO|nr:hypothetical protein [Cryobacterium psychrotolerans]SDK94522.1 hypothetical protein SAMN05216282_11922 [Cryobacterium psychrotolerans]
MTQHSAGAPELMPVLSRGKHRTPRSGGCFMEFASYLAGESWSDHPACTHPTLASMARMVNDCTSDAARSRLTSLIPSVIGLRGDDPRVELLVALRAATQALPVASMERQRALAVGILTCERNLAGMDAGSSANVTEQVREAFRRAPDTERWARDFIGFVGSRPRSKFTTHSAESILRISVPGIAEACVPDTDARLYDLLARAIEDCTRILGAPATARSASVPVLR